MLTAQELKTSPLFHDISYEEYRRMLTCFQAAQRSYVPEEQVYDFYILPDGRQSALWSGGRCP